MTLDQLITLSAQVAAGHPKDSPEEQVCYAIQDLLGESQPCGFEPPVVDPDMVSIMCGEDPCYQFTPGEARSYAAMLLRAADEADAWEARRRA